ncbi:MAG: leucine-rich repeat protein, partial [Hungatella sp.]|nr:leucine-rich repeat protein [Hungatella sp.]
GLTSVTLPEGLTSIGNNAFAGCSGLTSVTLPEGLTSIGYSVFYGCSGLTDVYYGGSKNDWLRISKESGNEQFDYAIIHCNDGDITPDNLTWSLEDGVLTISGTGNMKSYAFLHPAPWHQHADQIKRVVIGNGVTSLGCCAFEGCPVLADIIIPDSVTSIEEAAFMGCQSLTDVYYSGSEEMWRGVSVVETENEPLLNATIHYNSTGPDSSEDPGSITINRNLAAAVLYVPYSEVVAMADNMDNYDNILRITKGTLPDGLQLDSKAGKIYGTPKESGSFPFTITVDVPDNGGEYDLVLQVKENTDDNIFGSSDEGYELEQPIGEKTDQGYVLREYSDQLFVSAGKFEQFVDLWFNGEKLIRDKDYTAESGSTRITVRKQTFENKSKSGSNTISAEFRDENGDVKRTSQNFTVETDKPDENPGTGNKPGTGGSGGIGGGSGSGGSGGTGGGSGSGSGGGTGGGSGSGGSGGSNSGSGSGSGGNSAMPYTNDSWVRDEIGWRCKKPDNTWLTNGWYLLPYNETTGWYYFNEEGYMATGWLKDQEKWYYLNPVSDGTLGVMVTGWRLIDGKWYYLNEQADGTEGTMAASGWRQIPWGESTAWYYFNQEGHMASGWIQDQGRRYYLNPASGQTQGAMMTGWQLIDEIWYYFNEQADGTYGALMTNTWIGNYYVDNNGTRV